MTKPTIEIEQKIENEYTRILFICYYLKQYFYQIKGFKVIPYKKDSNIYLPDIPILKNEKFWEYIAHNDDEVFLKNKYKDEILAQIRPFVENKEGEIKKEIVENFISDVQILFPKSFIKIKKIKILITNFGSYCSNFTVESKSSYPIIFLRNDAPLSHLFEAILMIILGGENNIYSILDKDVSWEEKELFIDMILDSTFLKKYITKYTPIIKSLKIYDEKVEKDSNNFLYKLGFSNTVSIKFISKGLYLLNKNKIRLTPSEELIFRSLLKNRNKIVSFEQMANILWKNNPEKYSLQAITKIIQRIREKIRKTGLSPLFINTIKGIGYEMR